jgi:hypothetical protein
MPSVVPPADGAEWIAQYLGLRVAGCDHRQARSRIAAQLAEKNEPRLCRTGLVPVHPVPPPNETLEFRRELDALYARHGSQPAPGETSIDFEGEAVWIQEYVRLRMEGKPEADAHASVRQSIRAIAGL